MFQPISASSFVCLIVNCEKRICQPIDIEVNSKGFCIASLSSLIIYE